MEDQSELRENHLLAALPKIQLQRILPHLEYVLLPPGEVIYNFGDELTHIYFPNKNTVVSSLCNADDYDVEVGLCGNEGAVGFSALFGSQTTPHQNLVQVPGSASRLTVPSARDEFQRGERFQELILRFAHTMFVQVAQTALCNRLHSDEERLSRWLLHSNDRIDFQQLPLTRELMAKLLGRSASQASITVAILQKAGLIHYNESQVVITDREKLESAACSCYWVVRREAAKLLDTLKLA